MTLPNARQDTFGCQLANAADLGLVVTSAANVTTQTSNTIQDTNPRTIFCLAKMVSGTSLQIQGDINTTGTAPTFSSANMQSVTLTPTASAGFITFSTQAGSLSWGIKLTATGAPLCNAFAVLDLDRLGTGQDWVNMTSGQNATISAFNGPLTGSGAFSIQV